MQAVKAVTSSMTISCRLKWAKYKYTTVNTRQTRYSNTVTVKLPADDQKVPVAGTCSHKQWCPEVPSSSHTHNTCGHTNNTIRSYHRSLSVRLVLSASAMACTLSALMSVPSILSVRTRWATCMSWSPQNRCTCSLQYGWWTTPQGPLHNGNQRQHVPVCKVYHPYIPQSNPMHNNVSVFCTHESCSREQLLPSIDAIPRSPKTPASAMQVPLNLNVENEPATSWEADVTPTIPIRRWQTLQDQTFRYRPIENLIANH